MKTAVFDSRAYDEAFLSPAALAGGHELLFLELEQQLVFFISIAVLINL